MTREPHDVDDKAEAGSKGSVQERGPEQAAPRSPTLVVGWTLAVALVVLAASLGLFILRRSNNPHRATSSPVSGAIPNRPAPDFVVPLVDQFGRQVRLHQFRGKAVLLGFVSAKCTTTCPLTSQIMLQADRELGSAGSRVQLVGINVNPHATSVRDVHAYSAAHGMLHSWEFLTAPEPLLGPVWQAYHVQAAFRGRIYHEPVIYVIDPNGRERFLQWTPMSYSSITVQATQLADETAKLIGVPPPELTNRGPTSVVLPNQADSLTVVAGAGRGSRVRFGREHPHLVVFVATWVEQISNLPARLKALNRYAALARHRGWPTLIAVDLATVEPSAGALHDLLVRDHVTLSYPIVDDSAGALADGYQVQDAPWFALTTPRGTIAWAHKGWLPLSALQVAVAKAAATSMRR
jgi:cytochrome oxidase Cu insertion factor (SCO1/SenC/PrrC family)